MRTQTHAHTRTQTDTHTQYNIATTPQRHVTNLWPSGDSPAEGITVAVTSLPQYIAYAELAQLSGFRGMLHGPIGIIGTGVELGTAQILFQSSNPFRQGSSLLDHL